MALLSSTSTSRANKCHREDESTSQINYIFQEKHLKCQTKHLLVNVVKYFEKEAKKKSKGHPNVLERVSKATSKTVVYIKENLSNDIWPEITSAYDRIRLQPLI